MNLSKESQWAIDSQAFAASEHPMDHERRAVMRECLGEPVVRTPLHDVAALDAEHGDDVS